VLPSRLGGSSAKVFIAGAREIVRLPAEVKIEV
jgi:virulence-associated protein VagC